MQLVFSVTGATLYLGTAAALVHHLNAGGDKSVGSSQWILLAWGAAIVFHGLALYPQIVTHDGLNFCLCNAMSAVALLLTTLLLFMTPRRPAEILGVIVLPIAMLSLLVNQLFSGQWITDTTLNPALELHILISLLAYAVLMLSALQAIILAIQDRHLHDHHPGGWIRIMPPLTDTEHLLFQLITLGFVLLGLSLASGFMFLEDLFAQHLAHKTVLSIAAWAIFGILLWGRWRFGWRGRVALRWTLMGFVLLMVAYFGTKVVLQYILAD